MSEVASTSRYGRSQYQVQGRAPLTRTIVGRERCMSARPKTSPRTGREPGTFADLLLTESLKGGATKQAVIDRAISKYSKQYVAGREPSYEMLRVRAHRVLRESRVAGWVECSASWWEIESPLVDGE